jgi:predicted nucleic acid-binding protein
MKTIMKLEELASITQLGAFLSGTQAVAFSVLSDKDACYRWVQTELVKFRYLTLSKQDRGVVIQYLMKVTGYSRQQITRLINQYRKTGRIVRRQRTVSGFKKKYSAARHSLVGGDG